MKKLIFVCFMCLLSLATFSCKKDAAATPQREMGVLKVTVTPGNAVIAIRNKHFAPGENKIPAGTYLMAVECAGYKTVWKKVVVEDQKTTAVDVKMDPVTVSVLITCNEEAATITLNDDKGREMARNTSPLIVPDLPHGEYKVTVTMSGCVPESKTITVPNRSDRPDSPFKMHVDLKSNLGTLDLTVTPSNARFYVDGSETSNSVQQRQVLTVGEHTLRIVADGYYDATQTVMIEREKVTSVNLKLEQKPARLSILVPGHPDATVLLNGEVINTPGDWQKHPAGKYTIKVSKNGYDSEERTITLKPGVDERVIFEKLSRNTGVVYFTLSTPGVIVSVNGKAIGATQPNGNGGAKEFQIAGLSVGEEYVLSFKHPNQFAPFSKKIKVQKRGMQLDLGQIQFRVTNATLKFKNGRNRISGKVEVRKINDEKVEVTIPSAVGSGYTSETLRYAEIEIIPLKIDPPPAHFNTSFVDLLGELKELPRSEGKAVLAFRKLLPGSRVFIDDVEVGVSDGSEFQVKHIAGKVRVAVYHRRAVGNTKRYEYPSRIELKSGEVTYLPAPKLWIPEYSAVYLKNGSSIKNCRVVDRDPDSPQVMIETSPQDSMVIQRATIAKMEPYKD